LEALYEDVSGRFEKTFDTKPRFHQWGKHFGRALLRAHQTQMCTNFMDPGLQQYQGDVARQLAEEGGRIFISLPLPVRPRYLMENSAMMQAQWQPHDAQLQQLQQAAQPQQFYEGSGDYERAERQICACEWCRSRRQT